MPVFRTLPPCVKGKFVSITDLVPDFSQFFFYLDLFEFQCGYIRFNSGQPIINRLKFLVKFLVKLLVKFFVEFLVKFFIELLIELFIKFTIKIFIKLLIKVFIEFFIYQICYGL